MIQQDLRGKSLKMTTSNKVFKPPTKPSSTLKILTCAQNQTKILTTRKNKIWEREYLYKMISLLSRDVLLSHYCSFLYHTAEG